MSEYPGGCHCGNVALTFSTDVALADLSIRECQCTFCRKHGGRTSTDPNGHVEIRVSDAGRLTRYRFGQSVAEFLVCMHCGNYIAAYMAYDGGAVATLNINSLTDNPFGDRRGAGADYSAEDAASRAERRKRMWTPATLIVDA
ncbi:MAG: aldehyde-activating protein [Pseudomonadota bacterium]